MCKCSNDLAPQYLRDLVVRISDSDTRELENTENNHTVPLMRGVGGQTAFSFSIPIENVTIRYKATDYDTF